MNQPTSAVSGSDARVLTVRARQKSTLLIGLLCGGSIVVLDFFIVLACLPGIEQTLGATKGQLQLILAVYAVANGSLLIVGGGLGDIYGRRRMMLWGVAAFAIASLACGLATSAWSLIAFRAAQGFAGALLQPQVLGLLSLNFEVQDRPRVFGLYAASLGCAGIAAQLLGGLLVEILPANIGWRACFILSVPLCGLCIVLARRAKEYVPSSPKRIDIFGALLVGLALACICTFLTLGREQNWPGWTFGVLATGLTSALVLVAWQRRGHTSGNSRIIPDGILQHNRFWISLLTIFFFYGGVASLYFVLALHLRVHEGYSSLQVGLIFGWLATVFVVVSTWKRLKDWLGIYAMSVGLLTLILGHLAMRVTGSLDSGLLRTLGYLTSSSLQGLGIGALMGPLISTAVSKVNPDQASLGGGIVASVQQVGNSVGISLIGLAYFSNVPLGVSLAGAVWYLCTVGIGLAVVLRLASQSRS